MKAQTHSEAADAPSDSETVAADSAPNSTRPPEPLRGKRNSYEAEVLGRIWDRLHKRNEHSMIAIVGEEGSGKSYTAIKMADAIDPTFSADRVIYDVVDLLKILKNEEHDPGNAYVLDEAGVTLGNRTWHDRSQILANQALQLVRSHNLALFFTLPRLGELDTQTEGRLQAFYEITEKKPDKHVTGKWKYLDPDRSDGSGKIYKKYPRVYRNGQRIRVERLKFSPPSEDLVEPYEAAKAEYQEKVYEQTIAEFEDDDEDEDEEKSLKEIVADMKGDDLSDIVSIHGGNKQPYFDAELINVEYDLSVRDSRKAKKLLSRDEDVSPTDYTQG